MSVDLVSEPESEYSLNFDSLLEEVRAKRNAADEELPIETPEEEPAAEGAPAVEATTEVETPKPTGRRWEELQNEELPEDFPHGFYAKRKFADIARGISEAEGAMHRANERANKAEAALAAREVLENMLAEKQNAQPAQAPQASSQPRDTFEGFDLDRDLITEPERVMRQLDQTYQKRFDEMEQRIVQKAQGIVNEGERARLIKEQRAELVTKMERQAETAAASAFTKLNIPKENWRDVADLVVPILNNEYHPLYQKGGVLEEGNYLELIESSPLIKRAIASAVASQEGRTTTPPQVVNPPGSKAAVVTPKSDKPTYRLPDSARALAMQMAKGAGITDEAELEAYLQETASKIASNRQKRRGAK